MEQLEQEFTQLFMDVTKGFGLDMLTTKLFVIVYLEPDIISMDELAEKTGYSLATISNKMKILEQTGNAKRVKKPGTKKIYYKGEKDVFKIFKTKMEFMLKSFIRPGQVRLSELVKRYEKKKLNEKDDKRLEVAKNYLKQLKMMEKFLDSHIAMMEKTK